MLISLCCVARGHTDQSVVEVLDVQAVPALREHFGKVGLHVEVVGEQARPSNLRTRSMSKRFVPGSGASKTRSASTLLRNCSASDVATIDSMS